MGFCEQIIRLGLPGNQLGKGGKKQHAPRIVAPADKNVIRITSPQLQRFDLGKLSISVRACTRVAAGGGPVAACNGLYECSGIRCAYIMPRYV
jgi:hypothetical protein